MAWQYQGTEGAGGGKSGLGVQLSTSLSLPACLRLAVLTWASL